MQEFSKPLIQWYEQNHRDLPWRHTKNPYFIWLSEIILQQTRVNQGLPYYYKFIEQYPTVFDLAKATEEEVLNTWQGLGYYSRARNLHFTAKTIVQDYDGKFPSKYEEIMKLKGIGKYTGAAIASFAFDLPYAAVDGNVQRVLSRYFKIEDAINSTNGIKKIDRLSNELLDKLRPALFNQAMMELGATVCLPKNPNCENCPLSFGCGAFQSQSVLSYPIKEKKLKVQELHWTYFFISDGKKTFIQRRKSGIWINLYEFPLAEQHFKNPQMMLDYLSTEMQITLEKPEIIRVQEMIHKLTHRTIKAQFVKIFVKNLPQLKNVSTFVVDKNDIRTKYPVPQLIFNFINYDK